MFLKSLEYDLVGSILLIKPRKVHVDSVLSIGLRHTFWLIILLLHQ